MMGWQTLIGTEIDLAIDYLIKGELVAIPTETVYGLGANALNENGVAKIFIAKNRPQFNPLIVHTGSWEQAQAYIEDVPDVMHALAKQFSPGPITFLLKKSSIIPDIVTAGSNRVAIRIPNHPIALELLQKINFPLAAPSANPSGYISPTTAQHVYSNLLGKIPYILDGGNSIVGVESTIVGVNEHGQIVLYRSGGITKEQIESVVGYTIADESQLKSETPVTPGQLLTHYAPKTPMYLGDIGQLLKNHAGKKIVVMCFNQTITHVDIIKHYQLTTTNSLQEAASNLFNYLRMIDNDGADVILAEMVPEIGIGVAINDRLRKASNNF